MHVIPRLKVYRPLSSALFQSVRTTWRTNATSCAGGDRWSRSCEAATFLPSLFADAQSSGITNLEEMDGGGAGRHPEMLGGNWRRDKAASGSGEGCATGKLLAAMEDVCMWRSSARTTASTNISLRQPSARCLTFLTPLSVRVWSPSLDSSISDYHAHDLPDPKKRSRRRPDKPRRGWQLKLVNRP